MSEEDLSHETEERDILHTSQNKAIFRFEEGLFHEIQDQNTRFLSAEREATEITPGDF